MPCLLRLRRSTLVASTTLALLLGLVLVSSGPLPVDAADTVAPTVKSVSPASGATRISRTANVLATFSEPMSATTITTSTFTLVRKGTTTRISAVVSYNATTKQAILNPSSSLASRTTYTASVRGGTGGVRDRAGNMLATSKVWSFTTQDTVAPTVTSVSPAPYATGVNAYANVTAVFSEPMAPASISTSTFTLLKAGATSLVLATVTYDAMTRRATLNPGSKLASKSTYTATVRAGSTGVRDLAGNPLAANKSWRFTTADTVAPNTTISSGPSGAVSSTSATFGFAASEDGSTFACSLDGAAYTACSSPRSLTGLANGTHTFRVRATDPAGNTDATPATRTWTVDTLPPNTSITAGPSGWSTSAAASFSFAATEPGATFQCSLDGSSYTYCASPSSYTVLPDGVHTFRVRAKDAAGNQDATPAERIWTIDTVVPDTDIDGGTMGPMPYPEATFPFSSPDPAARFECSLDAAAYTACISPMKYTGLADGPHTFFVQAIDPAGNVDATPAWREWSVDTVPPETAILSGPPSTTESTTATFIFDAAGEDGTTFACSLDATDPIASGVECYAPHEHTGLEPGSHTFAVYAIDQSGNYDSTPATYTWTVAPPP